MGIYENSTDNIIFSDKSMRQLLSVLPLKIIMDALAIAIGKKKKKKAFRLERKK